MLQRFFVKARLWLEAMEGLDDPQGEYLQMLETRLSRLESEVAQLRLGHEPPVDRRRED